MEEQATQARQEIEAEKAHRSADQSVKTIMETTVDDSSAQEVKVKGINITPLLKEYFVAKKDMETSKSEYNSKTARYYAIKTPIVQLLKHTVGSHRLCFGDQEFLYVSQEKQASSRPTYELTLRALKEFMIKEHTTLSRTNSRFYCSMC